MVIRYTLGLVLATMLPAADFTFGTMLRAGIAGSGDWEMTTGTNPGDTSQPTVNAFGAGFASNYYNNGGWHYFEAGFDGVRGFTRLYDGSGALGSSFLSTSFASALPPASGATWTLSSYLRATGNQSGSAKPYTEVGLRNLALGSGLTVLTPFAATAYNANQTGSAAAMTTNVDPVVFHSTNAGGAWLVSGQVRFVGLAAFTTNGANRSQLQFGLTGSAVETATPEPATWLLCGAALLAIGFSRRR